MAIIAFSIAIFITFVSILHTKIKKEDNTTTFYIPRTMKIAIGLYIYAIVWFIFIRGIF